jgi:hypothetical protein
VQTQPRARDERSDASQPRARHKLGDEVEIRFFPSQSSTPVGEVVGIHFTFGKVTYDVDLTLGGETIRNLDNVFVEAVRKTT